MSENTKIPESSPPHFEIPKEISQKTPPSNVKEISAKILRPEETPTQVDFNLLERRVIHELEDVGKTHNIATQKEVIHSKQPSPKPLPKLPKPKSDIKEPAIKSQVSPTLALEDSFTYDPADAMNEVAVNSPQAGKPRLNDPGKHITQIWSDKAGNSSKEEIKRVDTIDALMKSAQAHIDHYENLLTDQTLKPSEKKEIEKKKEFHEGVLVKCKNSKESGVTWASSDFFRDILRGKEGLNSEKNTEGIKGAIAEYENLMTENYYSSPLAVNMRSQTCEVITVDAKVPPEKNSKSWVRVGVMSDMSNGFVNLHSLKELDQTLEKGVNQTANEMRTKMAVEIIEVWTTCKEKGNKNIDASSGFALKQLGFTPEEIEAIASQIGKKGSVLVPQIDQKNFNRVREVIQDTVEKRNSIVSQQFLQLVMEQIKNASPKDIEDGQLKMVHVALMNHNSKNVDGTGWNHNEDNEIRDMAAIFDQFDGKTLIFDEKGPYIDQKGNIHLPKMENLPQREITLRSLFINQSVQGYTKNDGTSKELNEIARGKLIDFHIEDKQQEKMDKIFNQKKAGYSSAADTIDIFLKSGFKVSTGCLSAKDRTGFVAALASDRVMRASDFPQSTRNEILKNQLKKGPGIKVILDNTRTKIMKVRPFFLEGLTKGPFSAKGYLDRAGIYVKQGIEILAERRRVKKFTKQGKVPGSTPSPKPKPPPARKPFS